MALNSGMDAQLTELLLPFRRDTVAFYSFLNGFVMRPDIQPPLCEPWQRVIRLLGKGCCKVPCPHHIQIIFFPVYTSHPCKIFRSECFVQIIPHEHPYSIAHDVELIRFQPPADGCQQFFFMLCKNFWAETVAGCPVVDVGQKTFCFRQFCVIITFFSMRNA